MTLRKGTLHSAHTPHTHGKHYELERFFSSPTGYIASPIFDLLFLNVYRQTKQQKRGRWVFGRFRTFWSKDAMAACSNQNLMRKVSTWLSARKVASNSFLENWINFEHSKFNEYNGMRVLVSIQMNTSKLWAKRSLFVLNQYHIDSKHICNTLKFLINLKRLNFDKRNSGFQLICQRKRKMCLSKIQLNHQLAEPWICMHWFWFIEPFRISYI